MLKLNERKYHGLFSAMIEGILILETIHDKNDNIIDYLIQDVNPAYERIFRRKAEELIGRKGSALFPDEYRTHLEWCKQAKQSDIPLIQELYNDDLKKHLRISVASSESNHFTITFLDITSQKEAEKELKASEEKYRHIIENARDIIYRTDVNGYFTYVNPAAEQITGYQKEELLGKHYLKLIPSEKRDEVSNFYIEQFKNREKNSYLEFPIKTKKGKIIWLGQQTQTFFNANGNVIGFQSLSRDITERKQIEEELRESNERYRQLVEHSPIPISIHQDEKIVYINPQGAKTLGGDNPEDFSSKSIWEIIHPDFHEKTRERVRKIYQHELSVAPLTEVKFFKLDGTVIDVEVMATLIDYKGRPASQVIFIDISERMKVEHALREQKGLLDDIFNNIQEGIGIVDESEVIRFANPAFGKIFGYSLHELTGKNLKELFSEKEIKKIETETIKRREGKTTSYEVEYISPEGKIKTLFISASPRFDREGNYKGAFGSVLDISAIVQATEQLKKSEEQLRDFLDNANDLIQMVNTDAKFQFTNKKWRDTLGYTEEEVKALTLWDIIHPENMEKCRNIFKRVISGESISNIEASFISKNGKKIIVEGSANCRFEDGKPILTRGIFRDVTEKKETEEKLIRSEARFRQLFRSIPDALFITSVDSHDMGRIIDVNPAAEIQTGYSHDELLRMNIARDIAIESNEDETKHINERLRAGETIHFEEQKRRKNGEIYWTDVMISPIMLEDRLVALSVNRDITLQKEAGKALRDSEERYRLLVETSGDAIIINQEGKFIFYNQAFLDLVGYTDEDMQKIEYSQIFSEKGIDILMEREKARNAGEKVPTLYETYFRKKDGTEITVEANVTIIEYQGKPATFAIIRDITEQKELLKALEHTLEKTRGLEGFIPICASCKKIRDEEKEGEQWVIPEMYISERIPDIQFSHGICPDCMEKLYPDIAKRIKKKPDHKH